MLSTFNKNWFKMFILDVFLNSCFLMAQPTLQSDFVIYPYAQHHPEIDGIMDNIWYNAPRYAIATVIAEQHEAMDWYDVSGEWRVMWDDEHIYYLVEIRDDIFQIGSNWNRDSIELYSDGDYSHGDVYDGYDDVQLRFHYGDTTRSVTPWTDGMGYLNERKKLPDVSGIEWEELDTEHGYILEVAMPTSDFLIYPEPGLMYGTDMQYNDDDDGKGSLDHKLLGHGEVERQNTDPSTFGTCIFSGWIVSDTLRVAKTNTKPTIDGELDFVWDEVSIVPVYSILDFTSLEDYADLSAEFRTMWDTNYLYYFIKVWDKDLTCDGTDDDGVLIYSDGDYSHGQDYDGKNDFQFDFVYDNSGQVVSDVQLGGNSSATSADLSGVVQAAKKFDGGLTLEVAFPIQSLLGVTPVSGSIYGMEVGYNDDDDGGEIDTKLRTYSKTDEIKPSDMVMAKLIGDYTVSVDSKEIDQLPVNFFLEQNYPNPFNPWTNISFNISKPGQTRLDIYNVEGHLVSTVVNEVLPVGLYKVAFDASDLPSGVYFYKIESSGFSQMKKMILIK